MDNFEPIDVSFLLNDEEVKKRSSNIENSISGAAQSAEQSVDQANAKVKQMLDMSNDVGDSITGVSQSTEQSVTQANAKVKQMFDASNKSINAQTTALANTKPQWNGMQNSINQLSRELPAFTYSAQTGFMAISNNLPILADEINRLRAANKALTDSGQEAVPIWKQLVKAGLSWQTMLSIGITLLTIFGKEVGNWIGELFKGKDALDAVKQSQEALNTAIKGSEYSKAINELGELTGIIKLAKDGQIDAKVAIDKYNDSLGKSAGFVKDLASAEQGLLDNSDAYIRMVLYKSAATAALQSSNKEIIENETKKIKLENKLEELREQQRSDLALQASGKTGSDRVDANKIRLKNQLEDIAEVESEIKKLEESSKNVHDKLLGKAAKIANEFNLDLFGGKGKDIKTVDEHAKLMERLEEIDKEYARKSFAKDEEELQALKDKFANIRAEVEKFNADPVNKGKEISISGLNATENKAVKDLTFRQETEKIKTDLEEKKQLYEEYELYKKQFGIDKAKEQYKKQIGEFDSYLDYVKSKVAENQTSILAVNTGTATGGQKERVNVLSGVKQDATTTESQKYNELLASLQDYETKRNQIISDYQEIRQDMIAKGDLKEIEELNKREAESLGVLDDEHVKGTEKYKALINGVEDLSVKAANTVIKNAKVMVAALLAAGKITEATAKEINKEIAEAEKSVGSGAKDKFNKIAGDIYAITSEFGDLGDAIGGFDEDLGEAVSMMGDLATVGLDAASSIASFQSGDIVGGLKSGISAVTGLLSVFNAAAESEKIIREEIKQWHDDIFAAQLAYNEELRTRLVLETEINDLYQSRVENIKEEYEANKENAKNNLLDQQKVFDKLLEQDVVVGKREIASGGILGALIGKKKTVDVKESIGELLGVGSFEDRDKDLFGNSYGVPDWITGTAQITDDIFFKLEKINSETPLTGDALEAYEQLQKLRDEYGSIEEAQRELQIQLQDTVVGNTAQAIGDSIAQGIANGKSSFEDFADDIEGFLRDAMIAGMNAKVIEPQMQKLQDQLFGYLEDDVLTSEEKAAFDEAYNNVIEQAQQYADAFNQTGIDLTDDTDSTGLTGGIRAALTEETGTELTGLFRAQYDMTKQIKVLNEETVSIAKQSYTVLNNHLLLAQKTEQNTANTVIELKTAVIELKSINSNTKGSANTARDLGY